MSVIPVFLRTATHADIAAIEALLNQCYRSDQGWTNEAHLIAGIRTTEAELQQVMDDDSQYLFVYPQTHNRQRDGTETGEILACIGVKFERTTNSKNLPVACPIAYIGMFAVRPEYQGKGVGNTLLQAVETFAHRHLGNGNSSNNDGNSKPKPAYQLQMSVLEQRPELLAYYQRRGYQLTGESIPFPEDGNNGEPLQQGLKLMLLAK